MMTKESPVIDTLRPETLKLIANELAAPLTYLINWSSRTEIFPSLFKNAIITPIFKGGNKLKLENY